MSLSLLQIKSTPQPPNFLAKRRAAFHSCYIGDSTGPSTPRAEAKRPRKLESACLDSAIMKGIYMKQRCLLDKRTNVVQQDLEPHNASRNLNLSSSFTDIAQIQTRTDPAAAAPRNFTCESGSS
jgi:hypothetical protein